MPLVRFLLVRMVAILPVVVVVAALAFLLMHSGDGDPAARLAGDASNESAIREIQAQLGLDRSLAVQFGSWCWRLLHGDLGVSIVSGWPVLDLIGQRVGPTLSLSVATLTVSVAVGVPVGVVAAWRQGSILDRAAMWTSVAGFAVPVFALGYFWIYLFSTRLGLFPVQGYVALADDPVGFAWHLVLPTLTLSLVYVALIARVTRASVLEVLSEDFIRTARAKGVPERVVMVRHALGNAMIPVVSIIGIGLTMLIGGVVVTESVFNLPGLGRLTVDSVMARDYPVVQGIILVLGVVYISINLVIDLSYALFDPRIGAR